MHTFVQLSGFGDTLLHYLLPFLFVLTVVVFVHELGHFLVARWCGVAIKTFSIGFGPEIVGFNDRHGTRWRLSWIPLGGYVKFIDDENAASAGQKSLEELTPEERAHSFQGKSLAPRAAIVAAGPIANFVLAVVIFTTIFGIFGERITAAKVDIVNPGSAAERAGFLPGDRVFSIDGPAIESFGEMQRIVGMSPDQPLHFVVERQGKTVDITATPERKEITDNFGNVIRLGLLGNSAQRLARRLDPEAPRSGHRVRAWRSRNAISSSPARSAISTTWSPGRESADQLGGPIRIAQVSGQVATAGFVALAQPRRHHFRQYWAAEFVPDTNARWRTSSVLRHRGHQGPAVERKHSRNRLPHRPRLCADADDLCNLE